MRYAYKTMKSPVGELKLLDSDKGLAAILWEDDDPQRVRLQAGEEDVLHPVLVEAERQLNEYFAGERKAFSVALDFVGTPFQQKVWRAMLSIPFGETRSYGDLARQIGNPKAGRAVGAANGKNPISIIGPCHRVIGASGELTGYAGGWRRRPSCDVVLFWIGGMKFTAYEAEGIKPLVANSPLMGWVYGIVSVGRFAALLGSVEIIIGILIALRPVWPTGSAAGSLLSAGMFFTTLSFLITTPGWEPSLGGFPALSGAVGQFLVKDVVLLGAALFTAGEALGARARQ